MSAPEHYWLEHRRYLEAGRLRWHAETADEHFWLDYWRQRLDSRYFRDAERHDLRSDELGRILLRELLPDGRHLEAGCGAGYWVAALRALGYAVEGIEYSESLVALVNRTYPALSVRYGDARAIDCPDASYDTYLSFGVVEHSPDGPEAYLAEAYRVLVPGGKIVITVPHLGRLRGMNARLGRYESRRPALPFFQFGFSAGEFSSMLSRVGFEIDETRPIQLHRLLMEESRLYRSLARARGFRFVVGLSRRLYGGRDGHMLLAVGHKPPAGRAVEIGSNTCSGDPGVSATGE